MSMASYYTPQQMAGGAKYNSKVRIGNWKEDIELNEQKLKDFELRRARGDLLLTKTSKRLAEAMQTVPHTFAEADVLKFGDSIMLTHELGSLACDPTDSLNSAGDTSASIFNNNKPVARNTFVLTKPAKSDAMDDIIRYDEPFCITSNPSMNICPRTGYVKHPSYLYSELKTGMHQSKLSMQQEVCMSRKESYHTQWVAKHINPAVRHRVVGKPVEPNVRVVLVHKATNIPLAAEDQFSYKTDFGKEFEVFCSNYSGTKRVNGLMAEKLGRRGADMVSAPLETANFFSFTTASTPEASIDNRTLKSMTPEIVLQLVKSLISEKGAGGIRGLSRVFNLLDERRTGSLSYADFKYGLIEYGLHLSDDEFDIILNYFDKNCDGSIYFDEFMSVFRVKPSLARQSLIKEAYNILDKDCSNTITLSEIEQCFDASLHPAVVSGYKSERDIMIDFVSGWDTQEKDGIITWEEFLVYYSDLSSLIDDDDYFELLIRNTWHIAGKGDVNTSNLRVLVKFKDGSEEVVTVTNDLGLDKSDTDAIITRLEAQGVEDIVAVSL